MLLSYRTALTSLNTAQSALSVITNNVANASTPGFTRQRVTLNNLGPTNLAGTRFPVGRGVEIGSLDRISTSLLSEQIREQQSFVGRYGARAEFLAQIETLLGEPNGSGISDRTASLFASLSSLSSAPEDSARRTDAVQSARDLTDLFNLLDRQMGNVGDTVNDAIRTEVREINGILDELKELNDRIASANLGGPTPSALLDQQGRLLQDLSNRIDIRSQRDQGGRVTVHSGNGVLVTPSFSNHLEVSVEDQITGELGLELAGSSATFGPRGGRLKGLMDLAENSVESSRSGLDTLARSLLLEFNRTFSTGIPSGGGYESLVSTNRVSDTNNDGDFLDERIGSANLPFSVSGGRVAINLTDEATGEVTREFIQVDPVSTTVGNLVNQLDQIDGLRAHVDNLGALRLTADGGTRFDFSNRILENGDPDGAFGSRRATVVGTAREPISIAAGSSFSVDVNGNGPVNVTLANQHDTLDSLAAEINATLNAAGAEAFVTNGVLAIRSNTGYPDGSTIQLADGTNSPLAALGLSTTLAIGGEQDVEVRFSGTFSDTQDRTYRFVPNMNGEIGKTAGLQIEVRDELNQVLTTLDVGEGYTEGTKIAFLDGLEVSFGAGRVESTSGHRVEATFLADSDTSDLLPAFGLGTLFTGDSAGNIGVRDALLEDPDLFAAGLSGAASNSGNLDRLLGLSETELDALGQRTIDGYYEGYITDLAIDANRARSTRDSQSVVLSTLEERRESIAGVNLDEELLLMEQYQQMFQASARFLATIQEVTDELFNLV